MRVSLFGIDVELIDTAGDWWKMYSSWIFGFISTMGAVQVFVPFMSWALPDWILGVIWFFIGVAGILARVLKQFNLTAEPEESSP